MMRNQRKKRTKKAYIAVHYLPGCTREVKKNKGQEFAICKEKSNSDPDTGKYKEKEDIKRKDR
ncbi:hypothetical protein JGG40_24205 [Salmonella enterica subsp. enterica serovar Derby]|nr:hypothetical protein [Salmonella enterica subsp. enterica serovar Derby]MBJ5636597.1 hypothetical protein [Salmonella enterica subsp. enterica serovar Typhimurium]